MKKLLPITVLVLLIIATAVACTEATSLSFAEESFTVEPETTFTPEVKIRPKNVSYTLASSNNTLATVDGTEVTAIKEGIVTIYAYAGDLTAQTTLYIQKESAGGDSDIVIKPSYTVRFEIVNYKDYGLESGSLESVYAIEGSILNIGDPVVTGYYVDYWYVDTDCTQKFDMSTPIYADTVLYAKISPRETAYNIVNGFVTGLVYPNLPHEELVLPEKEANGNIIYGIADEAFKGDEGIKKVTLPSSYKSVGTSAFAGCTALEEVIIPADSELHTVGANAFGPLLDENEEVTASCSSLTTLDLPDTVSRVGTYAFYMCENLVMDGIPSSLTYVEIYAFSGTKINNVSFANIVSVYEGAFKDCSALDTVTDTENVTRCDKLAFYNSKLYTDAYAAYRTEPSDDKAAFYAGTILFDCYPSFGKGAGSGKLKIKEGTTLIADEAFTDSAQSELTLYIDTLSAEAALDDNRDFLGQNLFCDGEGVFVVVGKGLSARYRSRYDTGTRNYADKIVEEEIIEVVGDNNSDVVNWGKHILLKKTDGGTSYYYDRFVPNESGTPRIIKLSALNLSYEIVRINLSAFNGIDNLETLELNKVNSIAYMGIAGCSKLKVIDLTRTVSPTVLEDSLSIQFSSVSPSCEVRVKKSDLTAYRSTWASAGSAYLKLEGV